MLLLFWVFSLSGRDWGAVGCSQRTMMMGLGNKGVVGVDGGEGERERGGEAACGDGFWFGRGGSAREIPCGRR